MPRSTPCGQSPAVSAASSPNDPSKPSSPQPLKRSSSQLSTGSAASGVPGGRSDEVGQPRGGGDSAGQLHGRASFADGVEHGVRDLPGGERTTQVQPVQAVEYGGDHRVLADTVGLAGAGGLADLDFGAGHGGVAQLQL